MLAEKLRNSIISYAIQGRLLELNNRLEFIDEKYIKDSEIKDNSQGLIIKIEDLNIEIPDNWRWVNLEQITQLITCGHASTPNYVEKGYPFLSAKNVKPSKFLFEDHKFISADLYNKLTKKNKPEIGNLLITRVGAGIGEACIIDKAFDFAIYVSLTLVKPINDVVDSKFLLYYIQSNEVQNRFKTDTYGKKASQGNLNVAKVRKLPIPLPPLAEQKRIVEKLDELLPLIDSLEKDEIKLNELMQKFPENMKSSILQAAIQGKITEQHLEDGISVEELASLINIRKDSLIEIPFDIPENWSFFRIDDLFEISTGANFKKEDQLNNKNGIRVLRGGNISQSDYHMLDNDIHIPFGSIKDKLFLKKGDIITPSVTSLENIGKAALIDVELENIVCGGFVFYFRLKFENYDFCKYLHKVFISEYIKKEFQNKTNKSGQAFYNLGKERIKDILIPVPPFSEQKRIVEKLDELLPIINHLNNS